MNNLRYYFISYSGVFAGMAFENQYVLEFDAHMTPKQVFDTVVSQITELHRIKPHIHSFYEV